MSRRKKEEDARTVNERQQDFLSAYTDCFSVTSAAEAAGVGRAAHYRWIRNDAKYAAAFKKLEQTAGEHLETEAITEDSHIEYERMRDFLRAYADCLSVTSAAEAAGVGRASHYRWIRKSPKYAAAFQKRKQIAGDYLEAEAIARAGEGWLEPVYYQGAVCGEVRRFDSGLMQFLLRGLLPEKYGSKTEISGPAGAPQQAKIEVVFVRPGETNVSFPL